MNDRRVAEGLSLRKADYFELLTGHLLFQHISERDSRLFKRKINNRLVQRIGVNHAALHDFRHQHAACLNSKQSGVQLFSFAGFRYGGHLNAERGGGRLIRKFADMLQLGLRQRRAGKPVIRFLLQYQIVRIHILNGRGIV
ncbi:hypothetical protein D3C77_378570 [compost metagenome]